MAADDEPALLKLVQAPITKRSQLVHCFDFVHGGACSRGEAVGGWECRLAGGDALFHSPCTF